MGEELLAFSDLVEILPGWNDIRFDGLLYSEYHDLPYDDSALEVAPKLKPRLVELSATDVQLRQLPGLRETDEQPVVEDRWYEVQLGERDEAGIDARIYESLIAEEYEPARVTDIRSPDPKTQRDLETKFSLDDLEDAAADKIDNLLAAISTGADCVACYDVGQGGCSALCSGAMPLIYCDLGGGITANASTYPAGFRVCHTEHQPIILSHWDMDHWSTADRDPKALDHPWIVPRQKLGKMHLALASKLNSRGNLLIWPSHHKPSTVGALEVVLCTGSSRNNGGLAVTVSLSNRQTVLLPGDASYKFIPGAKGRFYDGLIASHHGAHGTGTAPSASGNGQIAYSFGLLNTFSHPRKTAINRHVAAGWTRRFDTPNGNIRLGSGATPLGAPCGGTGCTLDLVQP